MAAQKKDFEDLPVLGIERVPFDSSRFRPRSGPHRESFTDTMHNLLHHASFMDFYMYRCEWKNNYRRLKTEEFHREFFDAIRYQNRTTDLACILERYLGCYVKVTTTHDTVAIHATKYFNGVPKHYFTSLHDRHDFNASSFDRDIAYILRAIRSDEMQMKEVCAVDEDSHPPPEGGAPLLDAKPDTPEHQLLARIRDMNRELTQQEQTIKDKYMELAERKQANDQMFKDYCEELDKTMAETAALGRVTDRYGYNPIDNIESMVDCMKASIKHWGEKDEIQKSLRSVYDEVLKVRKDAEEDVVAEKRKMEAARAQLDEVKKKYEEKRAKYAELSKEAEQKEQLTRGLEEETLNLRQYVEKYDKRLKEREAEALKVLQQQRELVAARRQVFDDKKRLAYMMEEIETERKGNKRMKEMIDQAQKEGHKDEIVNECVICMSDEATHAVVPCGCMVVCNECAGDTHLDLDKMPCPKCRGKVKSVLRTYFKVRKPSDKVHVPKKKEETQ